VQLSPMTPLSLEDLQRPDEELGIYLVNTWIGFQADIAGFSLDAIPDEWADTLLAASVKMDSNLFENAASEAMYRKACAGDFEAAGGMLRGYLKYDARAMVNEKYALIGIKLRRGNKKGGKKAAVVKKAAAASWHSLCVERAHALLAQGKNSRELAGILAQQFSVTPRQIREVLKKAEVK
jgi:hypothetical protein